MEKNEFWLTGRKATHS